VTPEMVEYCKGKGYVAVINEAHLYAPWADLLYACDGDWWESYNGCPDFQGEKWTVNDAAADKYDLYHIKGVPNLIYSDNPEEIALGGNSGYQILNMMDVWGKNNGYDRIILLGYDMGGLPGQQKHFWEKDHKPKIERGSNYHTWIKNFNKLAPKLQLPVTNCSLQSKLQCFPKKHLYNVL
jgi:hypothetical protein